MTVLTRDLINRTRRHLMTGKQDRVNKLDGAILAGAETLTFAYELKQVSDGTVISIDLEDFMVVTVSGTSPGSAITVIPGWNGTTPAPHDDGSIARLNAQFTDFDIFNELNDCLLSLSGRGCFYLKPVTLTYNSSTAGYDLAATDFISPYRVRYDTPGPSNDWPVLKRTDYYVDAHPDETEFPGGQQFVIKQGGSPSRPIRVSYRAKFAPLTAYDNNVTTVTGIHDVGIPILPLGAALYLLGGREVKRTFMTNQPEPRRQEEVPSGAMNRAMEPIAKMYEQKIQDYILYLARRYPEQI